MLILLGSLVLSTTATLPPPAPPVSESSFEIIPATAATMSDTHSSTYAAAYCNDGILDNMCHSSSTSAPWLRLTFATPQRIDYVRIYNRVACCQSRLGRYTVSYLAAETWHTCAQNQVPAACLGQSTAYTSGDCYGPLMSACTASNAEAIQVQLDQDDYLNLAEVQALKTTISGAIDAQLRPLLAELEALRARVTELEAANQCAQFSLDADTRSCVLTAQANSGAQSLKLRALTNHTHFV